MPKLPALSIRLLRVAVSLTVIAALSCGHLESPQFSDSEYGEFSSGEFSTPDEIYNSEDLKKVEHPRIERGPFKLQWPVKKMDISRGFISESRKSHAGLDIRGRKFDPIFAAHEGIIIYAGSSFRGYGKMIILEYDSTWATLYGHLAKHKVKSGQQVKAGEIIGLMGRTGRATGVHLHFELLRNKEPIDPKSALSNNSYANYFTY